MGGGSENRLREVIRESGSEPFVDMVDWQPFEKVYTYIMSSNVCLVPHIRHELTDTTIPHKLFQYMHMRKPVIVSDCPPLKRIVEETRAGLVFNANDQRSFIDAVCRLVEDPNLCQELGEAGHVAVEEKYNWREDAKVLLQCYSELESKYR